MSPGSNQITTAPGGEKIATFNVTGTLTIMAHFAKLDENNVVTEVRGYLQTTYLQLMALWVKTTCIQMEKHACTTFRRTWKQTSYNGNFRK